MEKLLFILFLFPTLLFAQQNRQLNREWELKFEKEKNSIPGKQGKDSVHKKEATPDLSCFKPTIVTPSFSAKDKSKGNYFYRNAKEESLIIVNDTSDKFHLNIDPLLNFQFGLDFADKTHEKLYNNTRGFIVRGALGKKLAF